MDLYPGCCTIMADYSSTPTITVFNHSEETWDFTVQPPFLINTARESLLMESPRILFDKEKMRPGMLALGNSTSITGNNLYRVTVQSGDAPDIRLAGETGSFNFRNPDFIYASSFL